jgi:glycosyltransferase involved in cell wall biosynthesis
MKILLVHDRFGAFGGAEVNIQLTASELKNRGHRVGLLHGPATGKNEQAWAETFSECFPLGADPRAHDAVLKEYNPDLIYVHKLDDLEVFEGLLNSGVPVVRMVHDHEMYCMRGYKYNYFTRKICTRPASLHCVFPCLGFVGRGSSKNRGLEWVSYRAKRREIRLNQRCQRLIAYSEYSKEELIRNGLSPEKIFIHVPIRCEGEKAPVASFSDRNLLLYAGQIIRGKGVDALLEALAKVRVSFECAIFGDGNHRLHCERLCAKLGLTGRVKFQGFVNSAEMMRSYLDASVLAVSSLWPEPFGMVGPEAMRYGLPVVAFDSGGIREWLKDGENGFLVPWNDTNSFAARIEELLKDKQLARTMGLRGRTRVNGEYEASQQVARLEELFEQVVQEAEDNKATRKARSMRIDSALTENWAALPCVAPGLKATNDPQPILNYE